MTGNLSRRTYLRAAAESPIVLVGFGLALVVGIALGAKAGVRRWVDFIAPVYDEYDDPWDCWGVECDCPEAEDYDEDEGCDCEGEEDAA